MAETFATSNANTNDPTSAHAAPVHGGYPQTDPADDYMARLPPLEGNAPAVIAGGPLLVEPEHWDSLDLQDDLQRPIEVDDAPTQVMGPVLPTQPIDVVRTTPVPLAKTPKGVRKRLEERLGTTASAGTPPPTPGAQPGENSHAQNEEPTPPPQPPTPPVPPAPAESAGTPEPEDIPPAPTTGSPDVPAPSPEASSSQANDLPPEPPTPRLENSDESVLLDRLKIQVVDVSHGVVTQAVDSAEAYLGEQTTQKGLKGMLKKIWHGNIARDYIRQREIRRGKESIIESGNVYSLQNGSESDHGQAMEAVVTRFSNDFIHEREQQHEMQAVTGGDVLEQGVKELVRNFAQGNLDTETFNEQKARLFTEFKQKLNGEDRQKGLLLADNILEVAQTAKAAFNHGVGMDRIEAALTAHAGDAKLGARSEVVRTATDKLVDRINGSRVGSLVNEATIGAATAIAMSIAKLTTQKAVTAAAAVVTMGAGAGIVAGAREHARIGQERTQHLRERATGQAANDDPSKRREQLEATRYDTIAATNLMDRLVESREAVDAANPQTLKDMIRNVAEAQTLIAASDEAAIDLIDYSGVTNVENERLRLDIALAEAKVAAREALDSADQLVREDAGLTNDFDTLVLEHTENLEAIIKMDMSGKNAAFHKLRRNRTLKMGAIGLASGVVIGSAIQEVRAALSDDLKGVFDNSDGTNRRTLLASLLGQQTDPDGGQLKPGFSDALKGHVEQYQTRHIEHEQVTRSARSFINKHPNRFTHIQREVWYDNNTPGVSEGNELRMNWGGPNGTGLSEKGNYVFNVADMTADGSTHNGLSANTQELIKQGKMAVAMTLTEGTQSHVVMVHVDANGNAIIDPDSWIGKNLFDTSNGQAQFTGAFAEVVQLTGKHDSIQSTRILATLVGENRAQRLHDTISHVTTRNQTPKFVFDHPQNGEGLNDVLNAQHDPTEIPGVLPIYGRRGLENRIAENTEQARTPYGYQGYEMGRIEQDWAAERSPRLRDDPEAVLNPQEELDWYRDEQRARRGQEYLDELDANIEGSPELQALNDKTRLVISMPVAAVQEAENIYGALALYAQQPADALEKTTVLLNLNWIDDAANDPTKQAAINKTIAEVERARQDFPDLKIASFQKVWPRQWVDEVRKGKIYGEVIKNLYDTGAMAVQRVMQEGKVANDQEILLVTNDADADGISRDYFNRYINAADQNPESDAFVGQIRWGTQEYNDYPGYGLSTWTMQLMNLLATRPRGFKVQPATIGPNSAFRLSAYAAVGGCIDNDEAGAGSDSELGRKILAARGISVAPAIGGYGPYGPTRKRASTSSRQVIATATGAEVDSAADRLLTAYRQGKWIPEAWGGFDKGGYKGRDERDESIPLAPAEDVGKDFEVIKARVERQIGDFITWWYPDAGLASWTLSTLFPDAEEKKAWSLAAQPGVDHDGKSMTRYDFKFTDDGSAQLQSRLLNFKDGRSFGEQFKHVMYSGPAPVMVSR